MEFGVPQGSILGPVLFNLYVTHLKQNGASDYHQYADDTTLLRHTKPAQFDIVVRSVQEEVDQLEQWCNTNNLYLNSAKTKIMVFSTLQMAKTHNLKNRDVMLRSRDRLLD